MNYLVNLLPGWAGFRLTGEKHRSLIAIMVVFGGLLAFVQAISSVSIGYSGIESLSNSGAPLALAAIGQTFIIVAGGLDLSAGGVVSLVNAVTASMPQTSTLGQIGVVLAGILIGSAAGAFNGFFIAFMRLQPIVVTLSTMFLLRGITLLILPQPGGLIAPALTQFFTGAVIPGLLPAPVLLILIGLGIWWVISRTRFGTSLFAVGSDSESAHAVGIDVPWIKFKAYVIGGMFYGAAGVFVGAQTGSADPLVGNPLLLQIFTAVVIGGTLLRGGRGSALGSVLGAYTLMLMINILLVLDFPAYYSTIAEGIILILAILGSSSDGKAGPKQAFLHAKNWFQSMRRGTLAGQVITGIEPLLLLRSKMPVAAASANKPTWLKRNKELLRYTLPAYVSFIVVLIVTQFIFPDLSILSFKYLGTLIVLGSFLAILALGQGSVILSGGLDLSVPWTIALCAIVSTSLIQGSDMTTIWVVPFVIAIGGAIGLINGLGVAVLGFPPIVITLATNGILQGLALLFSGGTPSGFTSPSLRWLMTGSVAGLPPVVYFVVLFVAFAVILLGRTVFGRWVYSVGSSPRAAYLSGVGVNSTLTGVYVLSGCCSALVGILLTGFSGQASLGMGDDYLLPSIAVVIVGGTLISGGRGHYLGMIGGVLLLTSLGTLLSGTTLPSAVRDIIFGMVILISVVTLRER